MEIITTHLNADFDAFASMVAAKKLYPDAAVAFPGSQEKNLRDFFMESTLYILSIDRAKDIDLDEVTRLIIVDTRQRSRIGRFSELAASGKVEIHLYDHHPDSDDDVKGHKELVRQVGATVTLLIQLMRERGIEVNSEEATILALGLYEDTGSFTFSSTTPEDLEAASWLLERGANLNIIQNVMTSELGRDQIEVLHQLIENAEVVNVGGIEITVTVASAEGYVGDIAILVHKYRDMESVNAVFALIRMEDRVHLVARSSIDEVNAGEIAAEFGGGGHATAASATIRQMSLYEAQEQLVALLQEKVRPKRKAAEIMSRPVITVGPHQTVNEAAEYLSRYQVSSLPVVSNGTVMGIIHRNAVEKVLHHGLGAHVVDEYMNPGVVFVTPEDSIEQVLRVTIEGRHRLVPVLEAGNLIGVISRSDLLEHMRLPRRSDSAGPDEYPSPRGRSKSVRRLMDERLPLRVVGVLRRAGEVAERRREIVYLVGGAVRDLLLRNHNLDIDLVVEGQGIAFAKELAAEYPGCRVKGHEKFGTAVVLFSTGFKIDIATARHEYYERPGALPTVETSSIKRDLYRRDFTMNTLAVHLNPKSLGQVLDFFGGARDIKEKIIRVLHNLAFVEDPTRILRAARFSSRFGFTIGKHTLHLMKAAINLKVFDKVEGKRLLNELVNMLNERNPLPALIQMTSLGIPQAIHPALVFTPRIWELVEAVTGVLSWWKYLSGKTDTDTVEPWVVYFVALTDGLNETLFEDVMRRLSVSPAQARDLIKERVMFRQTLALFARGEIAKPSRAAAGLRHLSIASLLFMMAKTTREQTRMAISDYITSHRHVRPLLTGNDLIAMGYDPGRLFTAVLKALRDARLDGEVTTREDEVALVHSLFPREGGSVTSALP